jgi:hypothetical protein
MLKCYLSDKQGADAVQRKAHLTGEPFSFPKEKDNAQVHKEMAD